MPFGGGGSTPGGSSAGLLLPPGQSQVAGQLGPLVQPLADQGVNALNAMGGVSPAQYAYPSVQSFFQNATNNPFQNQAISGAEQAAGLFQGVQSPYGQTGAGNLFDLAQSAGGNAGNFLSMSSNPAYGYAGQAGNSLSAFFQSLLNSGAGQSSPAIAQAFGIGGQYAPQLLEQGGRVSQDLGGMASHINQGAQDVYNNLTGMTGHVYQGAQDVYNALTGMTGHVYQGAQDVYNALTAQAGNIFTAANDPQQALYNRTQQQIKDQTNAQLGASGLGSSPYGAGVAGKTISDFNIDWQNNQLQRMIQGGQAAQGLDTAALNGILNGASTIQGLDTAALNGILGGASTIQGLDTAALGGVVNAAGQAGNLETAGLGAFGSGVSGAQGSLLSPLAGLSTQAATAEGLGGSALSSYLTPANAQTAAGLTSTNAFSNLFNNAAQGYAGAPNMIGNLVAGLSSSSGLPYNTYNAVQGNNFGAANNLISLGNQNYAAPQQATADLMKYLGIGQNASSLANTIGNTNFNQGMQTAQGLGSLFGAGANLLGGGGIGGLFGGGGGGLSQGASGAAGLSELAADPAIYGADAGAAFGGGGGSFLSSILPFAASA